MCHSPGGHSLSYDVVVRGGFDMHGQGSGSLSIPRTTDLGSHPRVCLCQHSHATHTHTHTHLSNLQNEQSIRFQKRSDTARLDIQSAD